MRWPFNERLHPTHSWGVTSVGAGFVVALAPAMPTMWMVVPVLVVLLGLLLVVVPVRRSKRGWDVAEPSATFRGGAIGGQSSVKVDSTAEILFDDTSISGQSNVEASHRPSNDKKVRSEDARSTTETVEEE